MADRICAECGAEFAIHEGRGAHSLYCPTCQGERRRRQSAVRFQRHALALMSEMVETIGPRVYSMRKEVIAKQDGKCATCGRRRKIYLTGEETGELNGLCLECFGDWATAKRGRS